MVISLFLASSRGDLLVVDEKAKETMRMKGAVCAMYGVTFAVCIALLAFACPAGSCSDEAATAPGASKPHRQYQLVWKVVKAAGHPDGPVLEVYKHNILVVEVNGVPVWTQACNARGDIDLSRWVGNGTNRLRFSGSREDWLDVEIVVWDKSLDIHKVSERLGVVQKLAIAPGDEARTLTFAASLSWNRPEFDKLDLSGAGNAQTLKEIHAILDKLEDSQRKREVNVLNAMAAEYFRYGELRSLQADYQDLLCDPSMLQEHVADNAITAADPCRNRNGRRLADGKEEVKFVCAPCGVLVYRGLTQRDTLPFIPYLYHYRADGDAELGANYRTAYPLIFVRRNKKWEIWDTSGATSI